jgi:hypothetical protein
LGTLALVALVTAIVATVLSVALDSDLAGNVQFAAIIAAVLLAAAAVAGRFLGFLRVVRPAARQQKLVLALVAALVVIMLLYVAASFGYGWLIYPVVLVAVLVFLGSAAARRLPRHPALPAEPAVMQVTGPVEPGRMRMARLLSVLALVCLTGGSTLLAITLIWASLAEGDSGSKSLAVALLVVMIWPPTFVLTWALGTAAFWAKGTLDPAAAVIAFLVGFLGSFLLVPALPLLVIAAVYIVRQQFWAPPRRPVGGPGPRQQPLAPGPHPA